MHVIDTKVNRQHYIAYATIVSFLLIVAMLISYAYLINKAVLNVVAREKAESQIATLNSHVGDLEYKEMTLQSTLTLDLAHSLGFTDTTNVTFVSRGEPAKNLSFSR